LIVLGRKEEKDGGQSFVSKQFEQRFTLPSGATPENITSALSKDGKLTVTAVRDPPAIKGKSKQSIDGNSDTQVSNKNDGLPHPRVKYDEDKFQISLDATNYKPDELDVKVEGNNIIIVAKQTIQESGGTRTRVFEQKFSMPSGVQSDKVTSTLSRDGVLVITAPRGIPSASQSYTKSIENSMNKVLSPSNWEENRAIPTQSHDTSRTTMQDTRSNLNDSGRSTLHDSTRSNPYESTRSTMQDSARSNMQDTRSSILDAPRPSIIDDAGFFDRKGSLFDHENSILAANSESGVSRVEYDNDNYKIHVNVKDFLPEELVVKTVDNTVKVDAKHEEKTASGNSYSTRSFSQSFTLPRGANPDAISSSLSKEGVLTISAPLPKSLGANGERPVPIKFN